MFKNNHAFFRNQKVQIQKIKKCINTSKQKRGKADHTRQQTKCTVLKKKYIIKSTKVIKEMKRPGCATSCLALSVIVLIIHLKGSQLHPEISHLSLSSRIPLLSEHKR